MFDVMMRGPRGSDMRAEIEILSHALVERADAAIALATSPQISGSAGGRSLDARTPKGVTVVRIADYAAAIGASVQLDLASGTAEISKGNRKLKLNIGRREAWLDGIPLTLPFPALRQGADQVYCPLETLARIM